MQWEFERFIGNAAIYATCPECGYRYNASNLTNIHNYCPKCGIYLYPPDDDVEVIWKERHWEDVFLNGD